MTEQITTPSPRTLARVTGIFYLLIFITAGFAEGFVRGGLVVPGDAATTAANIQASEGLWRAGFVADLIAFTLDALVGILFYILLKPVNSTLALVALVLRLLGHPVIATVNLLNHFAALHVLAGTGHLAAFTPDQLQALMMVFLDLHGTGYLLAGVFFGLHLTVLGHLMFRSARFPRWVAVLVGLAAVGYLIESFGTFLAPGGADLYAMIVLASAVLGEMVLTLYLLIKGVKTVPAAT
ncbi:DUF4386 domain-containing protein [bacterium]|nr:DUF4386 domain-containing protein [bacterium]